MSNHVLKSKLELPWIFFFEKKYLFKSPPQLYFPKPSTVKLDFSELLGNVKRTQKTRYSLPRRKRFVVKMSL